MEEATELPQLNVVGAWSNEFLAFESLATDMSTVRALVAELRKSPTDEARELIAEALWTAALITYARAFGAGKRKRYVNEVPTPPELRDRHRAVLELRSSHVAHYVANNQAEQAVTSVLLNPTTRAVHGVTGSWRVPRKSRSRSCWPRRLGDCRSRLRDRKGRRRRAEGQCRGRFLCCSP